MSTIMSRIRIAYRLCVLSNLNISAPILGSLLIVSQALSMSGRSSTSDINMGSTIMAIMRPNLPNSFNCRLSSSSGNILVGSEPILFVEMTVFFLLKKIYIAILYRIIWTHRLL